MTELYDPRSVLSKRLRDFLSNLFSPNWTLELASSVLSYEYLEARGIPPKDCDALGKLLLSRGRTDLWKTKPGGEESAEALLQATKAYPPGPQRFGVVCAIARNFALQGLLADPHVWLTGDPVTAKAMLDAAKAGLKASAILSEKGLDEAADAMAQIKAIRP